MTSECVFSRPIPKVMCLIDVIVGFMAT